MAKKRKRRVDQRSAREIPREVRLPGGAKLRAAGARVTPLVQSDDPYLEPPKPKKLTPKERRAARRAAKRERAQRQEAPVEPRTKSRTRSKYTIKQTEGTISESTRFASIIELFEAVTDVEEGIATFKRPLIFGPDRDTATMAYLRTQRDSVTGQNRKRLITVINFLKWLGRRARTHSLSLENVVATGMVTKYDAQMNEFTPTEVEARNIARAECLWAMHRTLQQED